MFPKLFPEQHSTFNSVPQSSCLRDFLQGRILPRTWFPRGLVLTESLQNRPSSSRVPSELPVPQSVIPSKVPLTTPIPRTRFHLRRHASNKGLSENDVFPKRVFPTEQLSSEYGFRRGLLGTASLQHHLPLGFPSECLPLSSIP